MATQAAAEQIDVVECLRQDEPFAAQLEAYPVFAFIAAMHQQLHSLAHAGAGPLTPRRTSVSDTAGVWRASPLPDAPLKGSLRVHTLAGPAPLDWAHHTFAVAPGFCYSKSSLFTADDCLTPHLELEMGAGGDGSRVLLYLNMDPRLSLTLSPAYLARYFTSAPPGCKRSWMQLEAAAVARPGFSRFVSPSLHVRQFSASALLFNLEAGSPEALAAGREVLAEAVAIWLAWLTAGGANSAHDAAALQAAAGAEALPADEAGRARLLADLATRSWAWRHFPKREAAAAAMKASFGEAAIEDYWASMAGDARIRV